MAELLVAGHGRVPDSLGVYLQETLPDDWIVVADPVVSRREVTAIVVGPAGLVLIDADDARGSAEEAEAAGATALAAVRAFLAEEYPTLRLSVTYLRAVEAGPRVTTWAAPARPSWRSLKPDGSDGPELAAAILAACPPVEPPAADAAMRQALAVALRDRQITPSQRTSRPFVFRSGSTLSGGPRKVWTIRDAVQHMDRYPEDGIYHLRNRTLEQWLAAEGAPHLAALARAAGDRCFDEPLRGLEEFLVGSNLVRRPEPILRPRRLDLGYILAGEAATGYVRISKGGRSGYLLGHLTTSDSCLRVAPETISGEQVDVAITVDTTELLIQPQPYEATVAVHVLGQAEPQTIAVRFRVAPVPSSFSRFVGRPAIGLLAGALMGGLVGLAWWIGTVLGAAPPKIGAMSVSPLFWLAVFGILWGSMGFLRGLLQPPAWPTAYAVVRWLYSILIWSVALGLFGATAVWCWYQGFLPGSHLRPGAMTIASYYGAALSILPATLQELTAQQRSGGLADRPWRQIGRRVMWAAASAGLLVTLAIAPTFVRPAWEQATQAGLWATVERRAAALWAEAAETADALARELYLLLHDRQPTTSSQPLLMPFTPSESGGGRR